MSALPEGVVIPTVVPFEDDGEIDVPTLRFVTRFYRDAGVHGLFVLGSAGQGPAMSTEQRKAALEVTMEEAGGRVPVIAHVGAADAFTGRELARHAASLAVTAIGIVPPYYYSDFSEFEVQRHYAEVAEGAPNLPIVVYDNPAYAGIAMPPAVVARLQKHVPQVAGIKMASGGLDTAFTYMRLMPGFSVYAGAAEYLATGVPYGLTGIINPPTSFFPELCLAVWEATKAGRLEEAIEKQKRLNAVRGVLSRFLAAHGRGTYREAMVLRGWPVKRYPRWTTRPFTDQEREELRSALVGAGAGDYIRQLVAS